MSSVIAILRTPELAGEPGGDISSIVSVHNTSTIVESFALTLVGEAAEWGTVEPSTLSLFPNTQQDVTITFRPPREWHIPPGNIPFGVMVTPQNDPEGSVVEEGVLAVAQFSALTAELIPQTTMGKRRGKLGLAIDSRGNAPIPVTLRGRDPSDTLVIGIKPRHLVLQPGTASFAKLKIVPRKRYLRGPQRQSRFKVSVEPEGADPILLDATMIQQALLPKGSFVGLAMLAALAAWFLVIRPQVKNAAVSAVQPQIATQQKQNVAVSQQLATTNKKASAAQSQADQAAAVAARAASSTTSSSTTTTAATTTTVAEGANGAGGTQATTTTTPTTTTAATTTTTTTPTTSSSSTTTSSTTTTTTLPTSSPSQLTPGPYSNAIEVVAAPGQVQQGTFVIPGGNELDLTDIIMENLTSVNGSTVQVGLELPNSSTPHFFFEMSLTQLTSQDFSLKTPLVLASGDTFVISVSCAGAGESSCAANVYFDGTVQLKG